MNCCRRNFIWLLIVCAFPLLAGCGYQFAGTGGMPGGIDRVNVAVFENRSGESGVESAFTNNLIYELTRRGGVSIVSADAANGRITGTIRSITTDTVSHEETYVTAERRVRVVVDVRLVSADGRTLWAGTGIEGREVYAVAGSGYMTDENKKAAIERLSEDMAEAIYNRMAADF
ncbi:MAG: LPS assembly lipoprotein LptE [Thermodesulfobacteriota bacterium]|nr:LPS assembly lipoprotein LptE [Thermodesulfobacteriota bacterium]